MVRVGVEVAAVDAEEEVPHVLPNPPSTSRLVVMVLALEFASGLPMGVVQDFVPVWARSEGLSREIVGALGALTGLWSFKILLAPLVDSLGTFKMWALGALFSMGALFTGAALASAYVVPVLMAVAVLGGLQDVALDGWLVAGTSPTQQGRVSGLRVAAYRTAMAIGGGGAVWIGGRLGWSFGWCVAVVCLVGVGIVIALLPSVPRTTRPLSLAFARELIVWTFGRNTLHVVVFAVLYKLGDAAAATMTRSFWVDGGLSTDEIGMIGALGGSVLTAMGALVGGEITTRIGLGRGLLLLGSAQLSSNLLYSLVALEPTSARVLSAGAFEAFTAGLGSAPLLALLMRAVGAEQVATRFAALTAVLGLSRALASAGSGFGVATIGYAAWFALTSLIALPALVIARGVARRVTVANSLAAPGPSA